MGIWERVHNPDFNYGEYAIIRNQTGLNNTAIQQMRLLTEDKIVNGLKEHYNGKIKNA